MASYWKYTSTGTNYWIYLIVENVDQDIANNRSKVRYKAYIEGASATSSWGTGSYTVSINGAQTSGSIQYDFSSSKTWYCVGSASAYVTSGYITHNSDGTKSINVSFSFSGASLVGSASINETFTLNTIPRASNVSVSNYSITNTSGSISATITPQATVFYHKWRWKIGSGAFGVWNNVDNVTTATNVSVANTSLLDGMPSSVSATFTIEVATYSDSNRTNLVGTKSASADVTVNTSNIKPSVALSNISLSFTPDREITVPVAGYSKVKTRCNTTNSRGANSFTNYFTVSRGTLQMTSSTTLSTEVVTNTLASSTSNYTLTISAYAVDSRGATSSTVTTSITVYGYKAPQVNLTAYRVRSMGSKDEDGAGTYVYVKVNGVLKSTFIGNALTDLACTYDGTIQSGAGEIEITDPTSTVEVWKELHDNQYVTFNASVSDKLSTSTATVTVHVASYPLDLYDDGHGTVGVAFGTTAERGMVKSALLLEVQDSIRSTNNMLVKAAGANARFRAQDTTHGGEIRMTWGGNHQHHGLLSTGYSTDGSTLTSSNMWLIYRTSDNKVRLSGGKATVDANGNIRAEGYGSFGGNLTTDGRFIANGGDIQSGTTELAQSTYNGAHSIAGKIYFASGNSATSLKAIQVMNHAGTYGTIVHVDQNNEATFYGKLSGSIATVTATLVSSANFTTLSYPSGFTVSNSVIINWAINTNTASNPAWATGHGLASGSDRTFVQQNKTNILFYNNQSAYYGKQVRVVLMKIG